jgi:hypothetical protein
MTYENLYKVLQYIILKNISAEKSYLKASQIAKEANVKLFLKNKAQGKRLFAEKLRLELNDALPARNLNEAFPKEPTCIFTKSMSAEFCNDETLLMDSWQDNEQTLKEFDALLEHPSLPLSIRFIIKEQIVFIRLDGLKMEQLLHL